MRIILVFISLFVFQFINWSQDNSVSSESIQKNLENKKEEFFKKRSAFISTSTKIYSVSEQQQLNKLEEELKKIDPESFEFNFVHYLNGKYNLNRASNLLKAYTLRPSDTFVQQEIFGYYLLTGDKINQLKFARIIEKYYSSVEYRYYSHLLEDKENEVIITSGFADSFPLYILQLLKGEGEKVLVVNLDFLKEANYRTLICKKLNISDINFFGNEKLFLKNMLQSKVLSSYISSTVHQNYSANLKNELYLSGLFYSIMGSDQLQNLEKFWSSFRSKNLENIKLVSSREKKLYQNYIPPLLTLYKLKKMNGMEDILLKEAIDLIAKRLNIEKKVQAILYSYDNE